MNPKGRSERERRSAQRAGNPTNPKRRTDGAARETPRREPR